MTTLDRAPHRAPHENAESADHLAEMARANLRHHARRKTERLAELKEAGFDPDQGGAPLTRLRPHAGDPRSLSEG